MRAREAADAEQRGDNRNVGLLRQLTNLCVGAGDDDAVARYNDRPLRRLNQLCGSRHFLGIDAIGVRPVAAQLHLVFPVELPLVLEHISRNVDQHRARASGRGDVEGFLHRPRDLVYVTHQLVVLGYRNRDPLDIRLLEAIAANQGADHLASDADERDGVHEGVGDAGHQVGRPRARRAVADARLAGYAGVGVGGVGGALLVLHQVMLNRVYLGLDACVAICRP